MCGFVSWPHRSAYGTLLSRRKAPSSCLYNQTLPPPPLPVAHWCVPFHYRFVFSIMSIDRILQWWTCWDWLLSCHLMPLWLVRVFACVLSVNAESVSLYGWTSVSPWPQERTLCSGASEVCLFYDSNSTTSDLGRHFLLVHEFTKFKYWEDQGTGGLIIRGT